MGTTDHVPQSRRRRWLLAAAVFAVLLGTYGAALLWFTQRVENDMQRNVRDAPVVEDYHHRGN